MTWFVDARIPLRLLSPPELEPALRDARPVALLVEDAGFEHLPDSAVLQMSFLAGDQQHRPECRCCAGRGLVADALDRMFQARIRGHCPWFEQVIGVVRSPQARHEVLDTLARDPLAQARFRAA